MPLYQGTSTIGWQFLGAGVAGDRIGVLVIPSIAGVLGVKHGSFSLYDFFPWIPPSGRPVFISAASIYTSGCALRSEFDYPGAAIQGLANWRVSGLDWSFYTGP